jgi:hypothetical protein
MAEQETAPEPTMQRAFDEAYQTEVAEKLRALIEELDAVEDTASVRRSLNEALRHLPA